MNHAPYDDLVGGAFSSLPDGVRHAHSSPLGAVGFLEIVRGDGLAGLIAGWLRLPQAGQGVRTVLRVEALGTDLRWVRDFGDQRIVSFQRRRGDGLEERFGPFWSSFRLEVEGDILVYRPVGVRLGRFAVPLFLSPRIHAAVSPAEGGWHVSVRVEHPRLGLLCRYSGIMRPE